MIRNNKGRPVKLTRRNDWLDFGKLLAILAVMIDHTNGILYDNPVIAWSSYYSVSLFILISGYVTYTSYCNRPYGIKKALKKILHILIHYSVACLVFEIFDDWHFSLENYMYKWTHFCASAPHYYVLLYIQLMIAAPILCSLIKKHSKVFETALVFTVLFIIAIYTTNYTDLLSVYGGGGKLFGGSYLLLFFLGMIFAREEYLVQRLSRMAYVLIPSLMLSVVLWVKFIAHDQLKLDGKLMFGRGFNPPSVSFMVYAILLFLLLMMIGSSRIHIRHLTKLFNSVSKIGQHTLYIFLYHRLFLDYINNLLVSKVQVIAYLNSNLWLKRMWLFSIMIWGSLLIENIFCTMGTRIKQVYLKRDYDDNIKKTEN